MPGLSRLEKIAPHHPALVRSIRLAMANDTNVHWHEHGVSREEREKLNGHKGCVVWFTGLSACGKSTVANLVDHKLHSRGRAQLRARRRQHPPRPERRAGHAQGAARRGVRQAVRPGLFGPGPRGEHPPHRRRGQAVLRRRASIAITAFISPYRVRPRPRAGDAGRRAISSRSSSMPRSRSARRAIPRASTRRPGPAS